MTADTYKAELETVIHAHVPQALVFVHELDNLLEISVSHTINVGPLEVDPFVVPASKLAGQIWPLLIEMPSDN